MTNVARKIYFYFGAIQINRNLSHFFSINFDAPIVIIGSPLWTLIAILTQLVFIAARVTVYQYSVITSLDAAVRPAGIFIVGFIAAYSEIIVACAAFAYLRSIVT